MDEQRGISVCCSISHPSKCPEKAINELKSLQQHLKNQGRLGAHGIDNGRSYCVALLSSDKRNVTKITVANKDKSHSVRKRSNYGYWSHLGPLSSSYIDGQITNERVITAQHDEELRQMIENEDKKIRKLGEQQSEATTLLANILCDRTIGQWQSSFKRNLQTLEKDLTRELRSNIDTCALGRIPDINAETLQALCKKALTSTDKEKCKNPLRLFGCENIGLRFDRSSVYTFYRIVLSAPVRGRVKATKVEFFKTPLRSADQEISPETSYKPNTLGGVLKNSAEQLKSLG